MFISCRIRRFSSNLPVFRVLFSIIHLSFCIFLDALANAGESICQLARKTFACTCAVRNSRQRAKWAPFSNAKWLYWLLPNFFKRWKIIIFPIFFCKSGVLTRLCYNLAIYGKITRFAAFFLVDDFCRLPYQSLKSNKINFSLGQHVVQKVPLDSRKPF